jgi:hypothetical protein
MSDLYETGFCVWIGEQAKLLRPGNAGEDDVANIAREIESMGRSENRELFSRSTVLLSQLIAKTRKPPAGRPVDKSNVKSELPEAIATTYSSVGSKAVIHFDKALDIFPDACPRSFDRAMQGEP